MYVRAMSHQSCLTLCNPMDCSTPAPLSMGFSRQEYWSGLPFPSPEDLPKPGMEPGSPAIRATSCTAGKSLSYKGSLQRLTSKQTRQMMVPVCTAP